MKDMIQELMLEEECLTVASVSGEWPEILRDLDAHLALG